MRKRIGCLLALACAIALSFDISLVSAQEIPSGVRYKPAADAANASAKLLLEGALNDAGKIPLDLLGEAVTCGPMLWKDLKPSGGEVLNQSKPVDVFLQVPQVIRTEARAMMTADQRRAFWSSLLAKYPNLKGATVRKASSAEISYYWATIPFDIEEPFFAIEAGSDRFIVNLRAENGRQVIFWLDRIGDFATLGPPLAAKDAETAAFDAVREIAALPQGWKRYRFAYDGGATLSINMPKIPDEHAGTAQAACNASITMMGRALSSNFEGMSFNAFYTSQLTRDPEQLSDKEKNCVLAAMAGPWLNGLVKAMRQAGNQVEPKTGTIKAITIDGHQGVEQDISIAPLRCRVRMALVGRYSYGALVLWKAGTPDDLPNSFLESLKIEP
jgi:hypothetical protein